MCRRGERKVEELKQNQGQEQGRLEASLVRSKRPRAGFRPRGARGHVS